MKFEVFIEDNIVYLMVDYKDFILAKTKYDERRMLVDTIEHYYLKFDIVFILDKITYNFIFNNITPNDKICFLYETDQFLNNHPKIQKRNASHCTNLLIL